MMPGIGFEEMVIFALLAIVVIGPKDLPLMMRKFGRFTGKMRSMAFEFKQGFDELGRQAELEELRKEVANLKAHTGLDDLKREFEEDRLGIEKDVNAAMAPVPAPTHPAAASAAAAAAATPAIPSYSGLSPDHPGYDTGEAHSIGGGLPEPEAVNGANGHGLNGHVEAEPYDASILGVHIVPDEDVRPAPVKQDTPA
ncbi:MAG: Sec-independent protein translocase protein TatB [Hyphomonadaceae bacterium]